MIKNLLEHIGGTILAHKDLKIGLISSATGGVSAAVANTNNVMWENLGHAGILISSSVGLLAFIRGCYSFHKELKKDRAERLKAATVKPIEIEK